MESIDKINIILAQKGMSGADLERKIGVSNSVYSQWNTKTTKPSNKSLLKVAKALEVDVSEITSDKAKKEKPAPIAESELDNNIIKMLVGLTPEELKQVDAFVQGLIAARKV